MYYKHVSFNSSEEKWRGAEAVIVACHRARAHLPGPAALAAKAAAPQGARSETHHAAHC